MKTRDRIANAFGYSLINRSKDHKLYETHLINVLKRYQINCIFDVGANRGQYGLLLRSLGYKGRIISFEPVKATFEALSSVSAKDPLWDVYPFALGNEDTVKIIKVIKNSDLSSFLKPNNALDHMFSAGGSEVEREESVAVRRLDTVFTEISSASGLAGRFALKMDTQGYDLEVFRGAVKTLEKIAVLQSEIANVPLYQGVPDLLTALSIYLQQGFEITGLFPESRDMDDLRVIEFNCLMVHKHLKGDT
jgi:FkbM family methyltransferase